MIITILSLKTCNSHFHWQVLEVKATNRMGEMNIFQCMRESLRATYGEKLMGLGGVMLLKKGKARIHVGVRSAL